jgi:hypothetical protein
MKTLGDTTTYVRERTATVRASRYPFSKMGTLLIG